MTNKQRPFWLLGVDVTPQPRPYSPPLPDRGMVYHPHPVRGSKPVTVGRQYSSVALLPEAEEGVSSSWVVLLRTGRVSTDQDKELVGTKQMDALLQDDSLPFYQELCVEVGDTGYSKPAYLHANRHHTNLVTIARARSNRTFYRQFVSTEKQNRYPFTLVRIVLYDEKGQPAFRRPLWLIVIGKQRHQLSLLQIYRAYVQRFDLEHFFRFGKQKLLLTSFQTPDDKHEETWWQLAHIAYAQLWMA